MSNENMRIWDKVSVTPPKYVKDNSFLSSVSGTYFYERATEVLGLIGESWGYSIVQDIFIDVGPMIKGGENLGQEKLHTLKINFWYISDGKKCEFEQYGHTKFMYLTNKGDVFYDEDYAKKSLTDAVKKSLSNLGFCADVFYSMHKDKAYQASVNEQIRIKAASDRDAATAEARREITQWAKKQCGVYEKMPTIESAQLANNKNIENAKTKCIAINGSPDFLIEMFNKKLAERISELNGE
ncbi:MAG: hypothetical protein OEM38_09300 [Gammaproteobacteria bacterium]|nr:hypothetical protein [Gammaproteobacteria bacterium]